MLSQEDYEADDDIDKTCEGKPIMNLTLNILKIMIIVMTADGVVIPTTERES